MQITTSLINTFGLRNNFGSGITACANYNNNAQKSYATAEPQQDSFVQSTNTAKTKNANNISFGAIVPPFAKNYVDTCYKILEEIKTCMKGQKLDKEVFVQKGTLLNRLTGENQEYDKGIWVKNNLDIGSGIELNYKVEQYGQGKYENIEFISGKIKDKIGGFTILPADMGIVLKDYVRPNRVVYNREGYLTELTRPYPSDSSRNCYSEWYSSYEKLQNGNIKRECSLYTPGYYEMKVYLEDGSNFKVGEIRYKTTQVLDKNGDIIAEVGKLDKEHGADECWFTPQDGMYPRRIDGATVCRLKYDDEPVLVIIENKKGVLNITDPKIQTHFKYLNGKPVNFENGVSDNVLLRHYVHMS